MTKWEILKEALKELLDMRKGDNQNNPFIWQEARTLEGVLGMMETIEEGKEADGVDD